MACTESVSDMRDAMRQINEVCAFDSYTCILVSYICTFDSDSYNQVCTFWSGTAIINSRDRREVMDQLRSEVLKCIH